MADNSPFSVRMDNEDKDKLLQLIQESGRSNKDFMSVLISAYELNKAKLDIPDIAKDIEGLQALTGRINDYYINIGKRITDIQKSKDLDFIKETEVYKNRIEVLKAENSKLDADFLRIQQAYNDVSSENEDIKNQLQHLKESLNDKTLIVEEYKSKNDNLLGILDEYKGYKIEIEEYKKLLFDAEGKNIELINTSKGKDTLIEKLNKDAAALKQENKKMIEELKTKHNTELEALKDKLELEKQKEILKLQQDHQSRLVEFQNERQQHIQELQQNHNSDIHEYQVKYKELLQQIESGKAAQHNNRNSGVQKQVDKKSTK